MSKLTDKAKKTPERKATLTLDGHQLEAVTTINVGDTVTLEVTAKLKRKSEGSYGCGDPDCDVCSDEENRIDASFEIDEIKIKGQSTKEGKISSKYNELVRKGVSPSKAMAQAIGEK